MSQYRRIYFTLAAGLVCISMHSLAADRAGPVTTTSVRNDVSPPLEELIAEYEEKRQNGITPNVAPNFVIPNVLDIDEGPVANKFQQPSADRSAVRGTNGEASPAIIVSVDGYQTADNLNQGLGNFIPPDTNGDVGLDFYVQYVNVGWLVLNKSDGSLASGPFVGNVFWQGFGGPCENDNAGDPIVLFDKLAQRWIFSQFTSSANPDGRQCFAVSTTSNPLGPYNRYEFVFPAVFNDYPHIGIWTDTTGSRSGYYFVTHDFSDVGGPNQAFEQASFAVVERDEMLAGNNPAQFVRFTDTAFNGISGFGALPPHLESIAVPAANACAPFIQGRPDLMGYIISDLCVDWNNTNNSTLSSPRVVDAGESWNPGPGSVIQPGGSAVDALDTLASFGRILYRASYRANDPATGLPDSYIVSFPVDVGSGQAGVRWAEINFSNSEEVFQGGFEEAELEFPAVGGAVANQSEYAPDSTTDRWMPGISVDRDGNLGLAYTASSVPENVFPSVRYTTRKFDDPRNTLRDEQVCVEGGGRQTDGAGRWGDYSSMSVDPVDECTFWASVEYQLTTANRNWSNRVCSFRFDDCGDPAAFFNSAVNSTANVCSATANNVGYDYGLLALNGLSETVTLSAAGLPMGISASFNPGTSVSSFPASGRVILSGINGLSSGDFTFQLMADSASVAASIDYVLSVDAAAVAGSPMLTSPANNATDAELVPQFQWNAQPDASTYRFELATDAGFSNVIASAIVSGTTFTPDFSLDTSTTYYWRVSGINNCGEGSPAMAFSFTTGSFFSGTAAACPGGTTPNVVFFDDIEGDVSDWTLPVAPVGTNTWQTSTARAFEGTSWFATDSDVMSDQYLVSPAITLPSAAQQPISMAFWNFQNMEANTGTGVDACWDGGLLEVSTDGGGTFTPIAGSNLLRDPYNGNITVNVDSPISGFEAWCADDLQPATGEQTDIPVVNLNALAGQTVQFRFRIGTDANTGDEGWYIDNVTVQGCQ